MTELLRAEIDEMVDRALAEDIGSGDLTAALVPDVEASAELITREDGVLCGCNWFDRVFQKIDSRVSVQWLRQDADHVKANETLCRVTGPARALLSGERTALNFLQTLSGTASMTAKYVQAVRGTRAVILDTRKTIPGLRHAQKYAVQCGGGQNHRLGLYDALLIKENHIAAAGSIPAVWAQVGDALTAGIPVEIEVENLEELRIALATGAQRVLLDNFDLTGLRSAVALAQGRAQLEASGGIDLHSVREIAQTGVDFISIGGLTKHLQALDLSMRFHLAEARNPAAKKR